MTMFNTLPIKQHKDFTFKEKKSNVKFTDNNLYILSVHNTSKQDPMHASFL